MKVSQAQRTRQRRTDFFIERWQGPGGLADFLDRYKRLQRQGWSVTVLYEFEGDEIIALGAPLSRPHDPSLDGAGIASAGKRVGAGRTEGVTA